MIHCNLTAYRGMVIIDCQTLHSIPDELKLVLDHSPWEKHCTVLNTGRHLGVSKEATDLLRQIQKAGLGLQGQLAWWESESSGGLANFWWLGGPQMIFNPKRTFYANGWGIFEHQVIPNEPPSEAKHLVDAHLEDGVCETPHWRFSLL